MSLKSKVFDGIEVINVGEPFDIAKNVPKEYEEACEIGGSWLLREMEPQYAEGQKQVVTNCHELKIACEKLFEVGSAAFAAGVPHMMVGFKVFPGVGL